MRTKDKNAPTYREVLGRGIIEILLIVLKKLFIMEFWEFQFREIPYPFSSGLDSHFYFIF
jgi:hypothetical protein